MSREHAESDRVRLDVWLHAVRFFKTRSVASDAIRRGQAQINGQRCKPAAQVKPGDRVRVQKSPFEWEVTVLKVIDRRVSAPLAAECYEESAESIARREKTADTLRQARLAQVHSEGRPSKRDRRQLDRLRHSTQKSDD